MRKALVINTFLKQLVSGDEKPFRRGREDYQKSDLAGHGSACLSFKPLGS